MKCYRIVSVVLCSSCLALVLPVAASGQVGLFQEGVGMYTDPSVASQASTFTLNRNKVSCGVGTVNVNGEVGPFEMIMYSLTVDSYVVQANIPRKITATGLMRSITRVGGIIVEDTDGTDINPSPHFYVAIGQDRDSPQPDKFDVHFRTPFWTSLNPMCTPSTIVEGGCRFGGNVFLGNVNATLNPQF